MIMASYNTTSIQHTFTSVHQGAQYLELLEGVMRPHDQPAQSEAPPTSPAPLGLAMLCLQHCHQPVVLSELRQER